MEQILCRFQHLGDQIFAELDDLSLAKSRETNRSWLHFICNKRFYKIKINEMLENTATDYGKLHGQKSRSKVHCPLIVMDTYFRGFIREKSGKWQSYNLIITPLQLAKEKGYVSICDCIIGGIDDKFPKANNGKTPLHYAALNGHLRVCELILNNADSTVDIIGCAHHQDLRSNIKDKTGKSFFFKYCFRYVAKYYCWNK